MSRGRGWYPNPRDGDVVEFEIDVEHDSVTVKTVSVNGCGAASRAASELARWAHGKTPEDGARIEPRELIGRLDLGPDEERCALTAIAALRAALIDAHVTELAEHEVGQR